MSGLPHRAPVQGDHDEVRRKRLGKRSHPPGTISWAEHEEAYSAYALRHGHGQSALRIAERGGFGYDELVWLLGLEPRTWEPLK
jgi:hypothetical protein